MLLGSAIGLTHRHAIQPHTSSEDLLPAMIFSHIRAHDEIVGCVGGCVFVHVCLCVCVRDCCEGQRERLSRTGAGSGARGAAPHLEPFAACHVLCLGLKISCGAWPANYLCHWKAPGDEGGVQLVSQLHRWSPLRLWSNWGISQSLCRLVHQPNEYSDYILSTDAATQSANLFQSC